MFFDTHIHTELSSDSRMKLEDALAAAEKAGIGLTLTEHFDYGMTSGSFENVNFEEYFGRYSSYRGDSLLLGVEIGMTTASKQMNQKICGEYPFDYVLGAVHMTDEIDVYVDCIENTPPLTTCEKYMKAAIQMASENSFFHSLAHIDYLSRYTEPPIIITYDIYQSLYEELFQILITKDKLLEVNTKRFDRKENLANLYAIYRGYKSMGGQYVTVGSDAHRPIGVGANLRPALAMVMDIGLKPVYFKNGAMVEIPPQDYQHLL